MRYTPIAAFKTAALPAEAMTRTIDRPPWDFAMKRKMAALMVGDVVGYSAMMERAEEQTAERLASCQALISEKVGLLDGRVFNTAGDAAFAEFPSAVNAVRGAFEIRSALAGVQEPTSEPLRMRFGLHIADVVVQGDDLVGDRVNLAARIQAAAEPDSIYVSAALFDHVRRNSAFIFSRNDNIFDTRSTASPRGTHSRATATMIAISPNPVPPTATRSLLGSPVVFCRSRATSPLTGCAPSQKKRKVWRCTKSSIALSSPSGTSLSGDSDCRRIDTQ
jgi:class 3 adenylate cyclase